MNIEVAQAVAWTGTVGAAILATKFVRDMLEERDDALAWSLAYRHRQIKREFAWVLTAGTPLIAAVGFALGCLGSFFGQIVVHLWKVLIS